MDEVSLFRVLWSKLDDEIRQNGFISKTVLPSLCPIEEIQASLDLPDDDCRPYQIFETCLKLFTVLILIEQPLLIYQYLERDLNDELVFNSSSEKPYLTDSQLKMFFPESAWQHEKILKMQWHIPPSLSKHTHQHFPADFAEKLPLLKAGDSIGGGAYGDIYRADFAPGHLEGHILHSSEVYKIVKKRSDKSWGVMLREIRIMRDLEHKAVLPLLASFDVPLPDPTDLYLVFPYAELGDIESWIHQRTTPDFLLNESDGGTSYLFSVLELLYSGLAYLHGKSVLHFDLKPKNILLFVDRSESLEETQPSLANIYTWKIADFGNARLMDPNIESMPKMSVSNVTKEYAPPQWFDPKGYQAVLTKHGKEFDIWSMGCIALQLMTLACEGWESGAVEEFRTRRRGKSDAPLFHQHRDVVQDWIVRLREQEVRTTYGRQISNVVLDLINESLNWDDPDQRPLAWEIEMYMFDATSPNEIPRHKSHRYSKLSQIIPEANSNNAHEIKNRDPIAQASKRGKSDIVSILQEKSWYGKSLLYPNETPYESEVSPSEFFTNLPHSFNNRRLFGQKNILRNISGCFFRGNNSGDGGAKFVGIHGLGGVGKSHIAFTFASQFRKPGDDVAIPRHTFWINAGNKSTLENSCSDICKKIGLQNSEDPVMTAKGWLEGQSSGRWLLILDGLDSSKNATEWYDMFPKAKWGQILVTTRNSDALLKFAAGFTDSKDKMIMAVPELDLKDARRLFDSYLSDPQQDSLLAVSDEDFQELLSVVKIPLFVRLAASYLLRYKGGNISLRELVMKLKTNISSIRRLGPLDAVHPKSDIDQMEEKLYNVFAVLLFPFVQEHNPCDSEEFELLGILSCFSCDFLHFEILKAFYPKDILGLKEMLGLYCRHGFITHCGNGQYTMHGLISEFVRQYMMENQQLGPIRVMNCFRYALDRIFEMYLHDKKTKYQKENGRIQRDSYLWKVDYMPHFEEFLTYIKKLKRVEEAALRLDTWKFGVYTAQSILTFSRTLATGNRDDDAILLLEFVVDRGIEETKGRAEALKVKIDILLSLATRLFDRRSGRRQDEYLQKAEKYARKGLKSAREQNLPGRIWRLWLILLRILMKLKLLPQAQEELSHLQTELETDHWNLDSEEKTKLAFRLQVEEGTLQLLDGLSKRLKSMIISSRSFFLELVEKVEIDMREEKDVILDTRKRLAEVDLVIPMDGPLEEAQIIYAGILKSKQEQFSNHSEHPEIARAQLNLWMAQLRRAQLQQGQLRSGPIEQAKNDLERLLAILKQKFGQKDGLTRDVAYALRVALELSDDWTGADTLKTEFDMLEKTEGGFWFDRENDPDPSDPWPAEWETPLKARSFLGRSIYLFASGSGMNRWPNMNAGLQRMLDEGLVFESNFDSDVD